MNTLVIIRRSSDYHVCVEGHPEIWGCGKTIPQAIGDFVMHHGNLVNIT